MSESGQDSQTEDFFGDFHAASVNTAPQNSESSDQNSNSNEGMTKVEDLTAAVPEAQNNDNQPAQNINNATPTDTTSGDFFNLDFSSPPNTGSGPAADFSEIKFPNGSLPVASDLLDINFGNLPVEPTPPTPGTPSIEVHFAAGSSDQNSEVSNETKSDTDSSAPTDSWSMSTQYPESRADTESVRDDVKSEQSLDDKSQLAEDGSDAFDFPTPKESAANGEKDDTPVNNTTDTMDFDFPAPSAQSERQAQDTVETPKTEGPSEGVLLTPVQPSEDKVQDDMISVTSDTVPTSNTNDFTFDDEFKSTPVTDAQSNNTEGKSDTSSLEHSTNEEHEKNNTEAKEEKKPEDTTTQSADDFFGSTPVVQSTETPATTSSDFDFPAPNSVSEQQIQEQGKPEESEPKTEAPSTNNEITFETETPATVSEDKQPEEPSQEKPKEESNETKPSNDFEFEGEFTATLTTVVEDKQPENIEETKPVVEDVPVKSNNDFDFEGEFTATPSTTVEEKQPESVEENKSDETPAKSDNDFNSESEFTAAPNVSSTNAEEKQPESVEENKSVETTTPATSDNDFEFPAATNTSAGESTQPIEEKKSDNDFEFEGEFAAAPSVPVVAANTENTQLTEEKKSDNDFEFEGEFTSAPTSSVPATSNTAQDDDDDFFDSEFQAAPTAPQVPQEQPQQAPTSGGTFEADFDEDFEEFAQAPTTPQQPVQPPQPVVPQTQWLFDGAETEVHDRLQALVSTLFPAPVTGKVLPDINTTVEEKLEELRKSTPVADTTAVALPAPSVFADHLKELLASLGPTTPVPGLQPARTRPKRSAFDTHLPKKEILTLWKKETSAVLHVSPRPTLPSARGKKRKNSATPSPNATPATAKQPPTQQPKASTPTTQPKAGILPPTAQQPKASPTLAKTNVQVSAQAVDNRPKPNETPEEKSNRIVNELVQSVPDLSFMLLEEYRTVNVVM